MIKTSDCLLSFKFLLVNSLSCMAWVVFSNHFITKSFYYQTKLFAGLVICVLAASLFSFSRAVNIIFSHTYSLLYSSISVQEKKMLVLWYFKFNRNLVFTDCPAVMLNIRDSSIKCWEEEYQCKATNPNFDSENRSSGIKTGQQKLNAIADEKLHLLLDIKLKRKTDNIGLKTMSVRSSGLWCHFPTKSRNLPVTEVENIFNADICSRGKKIKQNRKPTWEKINLFLR